MTHLTDEAEKQLERAKAEAEGRVAVLQERLKEVEAEATKVSLGWGGIGWELPR